MIKKLFVQKHEATDCEGRHWEWFDTKKSYEKLAEELKEWNGWFDGVRVVEKTFNENTFKITTKIVKTTKRVYDKGWWTGEVKETIG